MSRQKRMKNMNRRYNSASSQANRAAALAWDLGGISTAGRLEQAK